MMEKKSNFITVLAWVFIIGGGFATLTSIMQVIMVNVMFQNHDTSAFAQNAPAGTKFMFENFNLLVYFFSLFSVTTFISAIGLLKRKNWARFMFMGIMGFGILWMLVGIVMQYKFFNEIPIEKPGDGFDDFNTMKNTMQTFNLIISVGISVVFVWIIKKLKSLEIIEEFTLNKPLNQDAP